MKQNILFNKIEKGSRRIVNKWSTAKICCRWFSLWLQYRRELPFAIGNCEGWVTSFCWEFPEKTPTTKFGRSRAGCCRCAPSSFGRRFCAGNNSSVVPGFTNLRNWEKHSCVCQHGNMTRAIVWSCKSFTSTLPIKLNGGSIYN